MACLDGIQEDIAAIRRDLHRHPEVMYETKRTSALVADYLEGWGLEVTRGVGPHFGMGVVGVLRGAASEGGRTVVLRADMDALPLEEQTGAVYSSRRAGVMHACGHDAHTAMLLGAARALSRHKDNLPGTVKFVFQPAEEGALPSPLDGRMTSGGRDMIDAGVLEGADICFAMHVWPDLPAGTAGVHRAYAMAASTHFTIRFHGMPGHHSSPHLAADALMMAVQFAAGMKSFMATAVDPLEPAVLAFGSLHAGAAINAIAGESEIKGTFRAFDPATVERVTRELERLSQSTAEAHAGTRDIQLRVGTALRNDAAAAELALRAAESVLGESRALRLETPSLAGEDFALYAQQVPSAFLFLGVRNEAEGIVYPLHHPQFDLDERVLVPGAKLHVQFALEALGCKGHPQGEA
ncbi:amidohydrolase [Paenibacillus protaetiae]|uniref:Amidohydrolase n=2 Tax=Paenibacillus protaetiae TaxID=2509456 RepID=A0A4P6F2W8_9BACL|nr:amidohydrolase [Paenibacillus protaetiae]